ncbi:hypothetical protein [Olleya marilimosa]|uniref:DUF3137 domain-containing protein n=1 Tax=Olleya marilimosa TaxID=272164 RepID=A0ABR8LTB7_9FLAO|nr:hypothetical protein [Olleya marilimosa]MBD3863080.1 hypothetical protein [Olleya marilimosa]MBD3890578.1 hypothetical protein [Olleya marilimosa]
MYRDFFKNLAEKENGKFYFKDEDISIGMGVRSPNVLYKITFDYKNNPISIINRTGTAYVGIISCELNTTLQPIEFEINNTSHIQNLFLRKKSRLKIKSDNSNINYFLTKNDCINILSQIAKKENFSPVITCKFDGVWKIEAKYHLEFDNWIEPIEPIIELCKNLIDEFEKRIANISEKSYREMN